MKHPARFSDSVLVKIADLLDDWGWPNRVLDPFAGTGRVHELTAPAFSVGVELEPEWSQVHPRNIVANTLHLPFPAATFDAMITSPTFGNRFADHHNARDGSVRRSYKHDLGRDPHPDSSCTLHWGEGYRGFHDRAWTECLRVLKHESATGPGALVVVNVSNFIRKGVEQLVSEWHLNWFMDHGCQVIDIDTVPTPRMRYGANREARVPHENVFVLRYVAPIVNEDEEEHSYAYGQLAHPSARSPRPDEVDP